MKRSVHSTVLKSWLIALSLTFNFFTFDLTHAAEEIFTDFNVALTPPDGWQKMPPKSDRPSIVANFRNGTNTAAIFLIVKDAGKFDGAVNERFISQYEKSIVESGMGRRTSGHFLEVGGAPGYERRGLFSANGKETPTFVRIVCANGKIHMLQALHEGGDAGEDSDVRAAFDSFRFLTPPTIKTAAAKPTPSTFHRIARRLIRFKLAVVGLGVVVLAAMAIVVMLMLKRSRSRNRDSVRRHPR